MSKKVITILLMSALVLSLACGCKNNDTESTSSTASKVDSSVSSSTESSKQSESKAESSKQDNSNSDSSNSDSSIVTARTEKDFNEFMKKMDVITPQYSTDDVLKIFNTLGYPDSQLSGRFKLWYNFENCTLDIEDIGYGVLIHIEDNNTKEITTKLYPTKPKNPYDKNSNYRDKIQKLIDKVQPITTSSTREEVIDILGEPDESIESKEIRYDKYNFEDDKIEVTYYDGGLILNIWDSEKYEMIAVVYPK